MDITSGLISNKYKCCLHHRSRVEKYKLGKKTRTYISKVDKLLQTAYLEIVERDLKKTHRNLSKSDVKNISNFIFNNITSLNLLKLNKSSHKLLLSFANTLLQYVKNY